MSLVSLQHDFLQCVADLKWIDTQQGYQVTGGELYRADYLAKKDLPGYQTRAEREADAVLP